MAYVIKSFGQTDASFIQMTLIIVFQTKTGIKISTVAGHRQHKRAVKNIFAWKPWFS
jgi:hypothetical protein